MKKENVVVLCGLLAFSGAAYSQNNVDKAKFQVEQKGKGYYYESILKDVNAVDDSLQKSEKKPFVQILMDQSQMDLPNDPSLYKTAWSNPTISQGNTGTCWCFSTTSFYESEVLRETGKHVTLSQMYTVYWEYVEKARRFVQKRGDSVFGEGSESNAVARIMKEYGAVPRAAFVGLPDNRQFYSHEQMFKEMNTFLQSLKTSNAWNEEYVVSTIKSILNHYIGVPPTDFVVDGKKYTPQTYLKDYLKLNPDDYVEILSYKGQPYWQKVEYDVPDNWWHSREYYNIPLDDYMKIVKDAIKSGYTLSIGGDVSETGFSRETNCAIIPDYDIPQQYINDDARAFRFLDGTTTDDHGMQLIGILENYKGTGHDWYLIKDSSSGSRNISKIDPRFGYYFFRDDYVKLKMMDFTVNKKAVKDILARFH
ncbi:MAG: C1 family peptidase [Dysgonamonadaceae bacterium]